MTKTERMDLRVTSDTVRQLKELAALWGPVRPLSKADAVAVCIARTYGQSIETKTKEKRRCLT